MYKCQYCETEFTKKFNLVSHQATAQYCITLREEDQEEEQDLLFCPYCSKIYASKGNCARHKKTCPSRELAECKHQIAELKEELAKRKYESIMMRKKYQLLKSKLRKSQKEVAEGKIEVYEKIASSPSSTAFSPASTSSSAAASTPHHRKLEDIPTYRIEPLTTELVDGRLEAGAYPYETYRSQGVGGIINFIKGLIMKETSEGIERNYVCTDVSRKTCHRLSAPGEWTKDVGAGFIGVIFSGMTKIVREYSQYDGEQLIKAYEENGRDDWDPKSEEFEDIMEAMYEPDSPILRNIQARICKIAAI